MVVELVLSVADVDAGLGQRPEAVDVKAFVEIRELNDST